MKPITKIPNETPDYAPRTLYYVWPYVEYLITAISEIRMEPSISKFQT